MLTMMLTAAFAGQSALLCRAADQKVMLIAAHIGRLQLMPWLLLGLSHQQVWHALPGLQHSLLFPLKGQHWVAAPELSWQQALC